MADFLTDIEILLAKIATSHFVPPFGDIGVTYTLHLWLFGKRVVDFPLVLIGHFSPGVRKGVGRSFVRYCGQGSSLLWTPALRPLCRSNTPAQGEEGNW